MQRLPLVRSWLVLERTAVDADMRESGFALGAPGRLAAGGGAVVDAAPAGHNCESASILRNSVSRRFVSSVTGMLLTFPVKSPAIGPQSSGAGSMC